MLSFDPHCQLVRNRVAVCLAVSSLAAFPACSDSDDPEKDPAYQGTAGAAAVSDSGVTPDADPEDQLPTREQICVEGPPGGLPIKDQACEHHACGDTCDPCETGIGQNPGCLRDAGVFRCTWQHMCTQTSD